MHIHYPYIHTLVSISSTYLHPVSRLQISSVLVLVYWYWLPISRSRLVEQQGSCSWRRVVGTRCSQCFRFNKCLQREDTEGYSFPGVQLFGFRRTQSMYEVEPSIDHSHWTPSLGQASFCHWPILPSQQTWWLWWSELGSQTVSGRRQLSWLELLLNHLPVPAPAKAPVASISASVIQIAQNRSIISG